MDKIILLVQGVMDKSFLLQLFITSSIERIDWRKYWSEKILELDLEWKTYIYKPFSLVISVKKEESSDCDSMVWIYISKWSLNVKYSSMIFSINCSVSSAKSSVRMNSTMVSVWLWIWILMGALTYNFLVSKFHEAY